MTTKVGDTSAVYLEVLSIRSGERGPYLEIGWRRPDGELHRLSLIPKDGAVTVEDVRTLLCAREARAAKQVEVLDG